MRIIQREGSTKVHMVFGRHKLTDEQILKLIEAKELEQEKR